MTSIELNHDIFGGLKTLPEVVKVGPHEMMSDRVNENDLLEVLARNPDHSAIISKTEQDDRKVLVDSGIHRIYAIDGGNQNASLYLQ